jgi:hypothetical protein
MLHEVFHVSLSVLYKIITVQLHSGKNCAIWVKRMLTDEHEHKQKK